MAKAGADADEWVQGHDPEVERLREENARLSKLLGLVETYTSKPSATPRWRMPKKRHHSRAATCVAQLSDMHFDEVVNPAEVGGLNAYSREIARLRLRRWAEKLVEFMLRNPHEWDGLLLLALGDDLSGDIHDELRETNEDVLSGTVVFWAAELAAALLFVIDALEAEGVKVHIDVKKLVGNHGRFTKQKPFKRRARASWDWLLWQLVASHFKADARVSFEFAGGSYLFVQVYDRHIFLTHGDEVGGGGGWSGVFTPLGRIHSNAIALGVAHGVRPAYSVAGHWHQTVLAHHRGIVCGGAVKGWDEFAAGLRLRPEPAMQNVWIETPTHGVTLAGPLFLEDKKAEGWA